MFYTASLFEVKWKSWARIAGTVSDEELAAGGDGDAGGFQVLEEIDRALVEPEVVDRVNDFAVFDQPDAVAGEAGDHRVLRVHRANVPEPRDQQGTRGFGDQGFERLVRAFQDQAAGERDGLDLGFLGPVAVDGERFHDAVFDPGGLAGRQPAAAATDAAAAAAAAAAGPGRSRVARVERVGAKRDAVGEELFTQASAAAGLR